MGKAAEVFAIPELLELILLSLPVTTAQQELSSIRTSITGQAVCNTWHCLVRESTRIQSLCYLPAHVSPSSSSALPSAWEIRSTTPPLIRHNPFICSLLLRGRRWGGAWPFNGDCVSSLYGPTPRQQLWSFFFEISRSEFTRLPAAGPWRDMLATDPLFRETWCTRTSQMTGIDSLLYKSSRDVQELAAAEGNDERMWTPKMEAESRLKGYQMARGRQLRRDCREKGFTLGDVVDVLGEVFESNPDMEWVVLESVRRPDFYMGILRQCYDVKQEIVPAALVDQVLVL
jgi:hypothetical protein